MNDDSDANENGRPKLPSSGVGGKLGRAGLQIAGGAIPFFGGVLSAAAGAWSEQEQDHVRKVFEQWMQMFEEELRDKAQTIKEIAARLDLSDENVRDRIESDAYQTLMKKAFRNWQNIDSGSKRKKVRNILANAADCRLTSDDVIRLFLDWLDEYSDLHFAVIGVIYNRGPIGRGDIWLELGKDPVREDSAEADLFRLLINDLALGRVARQQRATDYQGNFVKKQPGRRARGVGGGSRTMKSAFDNSDLYELTELGKQFVHYAMNEIVPRVSFDEEA